MPYIISIPYEFQDLARSTSGERTERSQTYVSTRSPIVPQRQHLKGEGYMTCYKYNIVEKRVK
jgi:hypothetical protein